MPRAKNHQGGTDMGNDSIIAFKTREYRRAFAAEAANLASQGQSTISSGWRQPTTTGTKSREPSDSVASATDSPGFFPVIAPPESIVAMSL